MSVKVMGKVWDTDLPGNLKIVLLAYADAAEHDGTQIWPGRGRIALMCGIAVSTADRLTRALIEGGYLVQVAKGHRGQRAAYEIPLDRLAVAYQSDIHSEADSLSIEADSLPPDAGKPITPDSPPVLVDPSSSSVLPIAATPRRGPDGLTIAEEERMATRPRNPWWDVTVELFGKPAANQQALYGRFVDMANKDWPPNEIRRRAGLLADLWGVKAVTVASLEKYWSRFDGQIGQVTDRDVEAFTAAEARTAMVERLADE